MAIPNKDINTYIFRTEVLMCAAMEKYYSWEVLKYDKASSNTASLRHYWLEKLLQRQLREFDRG
jgi:hypothetical protein